MPVAVSRWIISGRNREPPAKNRFTEDQQQDQKQNDFDSFPAIPPPARCDRPKNNERSHNEIARCIAHPPGNPDRSVICPGSKTAQRETGHAQNRTDHRARHRRERELEDILSPIENASAAGELIDQPRAAKRFKCIASGDAK
jgi:hypothetical protein